MKIWSGLVLTKKEHLTPKQHQEIQNETETYNIPVWGTPYSAQQHLTNPDNNVGVNGTKPKDSYGFDPCCPDRSIQKMGDNLENMQLESWIFGFHEEGTLILNALNMC